MVCPHCNAAFGDWEPSCPVCGAPSSGDGPSEASSEGVPAEGAGPSGGGCPACGGPIDEWELYDLRSDAKELKSVYGDPRYADVQQHLETELARLRRELKVPESDPPESGRGRAKKQTSKKKT